MPGEEEKPDQFKEFAEKMVSAIDALGERIGAVETNVNTQNTNIQTLNDKATPPGGDKPSTPTLAEMDLESMSRGDFAGAITASVVEAITKQMQPMNDRVGNLQISTEEQNLRTEFNEVAGRHDDFKLYSEAMSGMIETHSHLSVEEMYTIAKANNPEIATTAAEAEADANPPATQEATFGGLMPTSGSTTQNKGEASANDAAEDAWNDTMTGSPLAEAQ